jgi:hypothetical protein
LSHQQHSTSKTEQNCRKSHKKFFRAWDDWDKCLFQGMETKMHRKVLNIIETGIFCANSSISSYQLYSI